MSDRPYVRFVRSPNLKLAKGGIRGAANSDVSRLVPCILTNPNILCIRSFIFEDFLDRAQMLRYGSLPVGGDIGRCGRDSAARNG